MSRLLIVFALMLGSLSMSTAAWAAEDQNEADVRCIVVAYGLIQSEDPQVKSFGAGASLYFLGRVRGRAPTLDLEAMILSQIKLMTPVLLRGEMQRCSSVLQTEGGNLRTIGADLKQKLAPPTPPAPATK